MKLLAIDTSTEACSVALWLDGDVRQRYIVAPQQHAKLLLSMIDELMAEAQLTPALLEGVVFGQGPGSFTGVRIAAAAAQAIALAVDCGVVGVSTLQALAHRAWREYNVEYALAAIDARMQQVYWGSYATLAFGASRAVARELVSNPEEVFAPDSSGESGQWTGVGSGVPVYADVLQKNGILINTETGNLFPSAADMLHLAVPRFSQGEAVAAEFAMPVYLRDNVAVTEKDRADKRVL